MLSPSLDPLRASPHFTTVYNPVYQLPLYSDPALNVFFSVLTEAPSFAEPGDAIMEKIANSKVIIPCPAEGMIRFR